jgi:hypothetical protein
MKIKLTTTIYFDGVPYPAGSIIDPEAIGANGDAIVHWMWGEQVDDEAPIAIVPVFSDPVVEPIAEPIAEPIVGQVAELSPQVSPELSPQPIPEPPPAPRRKRNK